MLRMGLSMDTITPTGGATGYAPNGNLLSYTDSVNGTWSFGAGGYDSLNRLVSGSATAGPYQGLQMSWSYDSFGNRKSESFGGSTGESLPPSTAAQYNANNQVTGGSLGYDAAGNVTADNANYYLYDGEGRVCAVQDRTFGGMTEYIYNAEGTRVAKGTIYAWTCDITSNGFTLTNTYVIGPSGEQLTETDGSGNWLHTNVYAAGQLLATYSYTDNSHAATDTYFALSDWLGTKRAVVSAGGCGTGYISLPYGDSLTATSLPGFTQCPDATEHHFTGKDRDTESGLDYFGARYYASSMGRFMSPDPSRLYFADPMNPQSLNLYSYVYNNPLTNIDPTGMDACANDNGNGTATIVNAADGGGVECPGNGIYIETTQQVTAIGLNGNGDLSVYGTDNGLFSPDGSAYNVSQSMTVSADGGSSSTGLETISSPGTQYIVSRPRYNGSGYSLADICSASALLHSGAATALDAFGIIPGEGNLLKGAQALGGVISAGMAVFESGNKTITQNVATSGSGLGLTAVDAGKVFEKGTPEAKAVPIAGNVLSAYSAYSDTREMRAYYNDCMAGKN